MADQVTVEVVNIEDLQERLKALQTKNPRMRRDINKIIAYVLKGARKKVMEDAKAKLPNDPRKAYQAVRHSVYKRIFGGNVNILARKKNNGKEYVGGNHSRPRLARTAQVEGYYGSDRGFILRFINAGTKPRTAKHMNAHGIMRTERPKVKGEQMNRAYRIPRKYLGGIGNRGQIEGGEWFSSSSTQAMDSAAGNLEALISRAIYEVWGDAAVNSNII